MKGEATKAATTRVETIQEATLATVVWLPNCQVVADARVNPAYVGWTHSVVTTRGMISA